MTGLQTTIRRVVDVALRECGILRRVPIYWFCMIVFPIFVTLFFTTMMGDGQPSDMPVGVVDLDNSTTSRRIVRTLDSFQSSKVVARYTSMEEARQAIQRNEIYGFLYIPKGMSANLLSSRQPNISFYYSMTSLTSGALVFRDLKTVSQLASASVGQSLLTAKGAAPTQVKAYLQPIVIDLHPLSNAATDYNVYLSTMLVPGIIMLFVFLISVYSIGTELKFGRSQEWVERAGGNIGVALAGKLLPQTLVFLAVIYAYMFYVFEVLNFPHPGGVAHILLLGLLQVLASQGFGVFVFTLMPSLRMSMSVCSLWGVMSFSVVGTAYPVSDMDAPVQAMSWLFPLRHYFMVYRTTILNDYPLADVWVHVVALVAFAVLPLILLPKLKNAMLTYEYVP